MATSSSPEDTPARVVDTIEELVDLVELRDIVVYEVRARRADGGFDLEFDDVDELGVFADEGDDDDEMRPTLRGVQVMTRSDERTLDVRVVARVDNSAAVVNVDLAAVYSKAAEFEIAADVLTDFVARVSLMSLFPFIREVVLTESTRLGASMKLGLLKASSLQPKP